MAQGKRTREETRAKVVYTEQDMINHCSLFKCQACGAKPSSDNDIELEIDHIIPYSMGGLSVANNYQVLCMKCNVSKGNKFIHNHNNYEG